MGSERRDRTLSVTVLAWGVVEFWNELDRLPRLTLAQAFGGADASQLLFSILKKVEVYWNLRINSDGPFQV